MRRSALTAGLIVGLGGAFLAVRSGRLRLGDRIASSTRRGAALMRDALGTRLSGLRENSSDWEALSAQPRRFRSPESLDFIV